MQADSIESEIVLTFFEALYKQDLAEASGNLYIEVRGKKTQENGMSFRRSYKSIEDLLEDRDTWDKGLNYWYGVALRQNPKGGKKEDCALLTALFVDIDYGQKGHKKINRWKSRQEALRAISNFRLRPSILVHSGYGYQAYWLLKEPLDLRNGDFEKVESIHQGLALAIGGDGGTQDVSRILRIPGTHNVKIPDNPKPVTIRWCDPDLIYDLKDFEHYRISQEQPKEKHSSKPEEGVGAIDIWSLGIQGWVRTLILTGAKEGYKSRSERDHAVIGELAKAGVDFPSIVSIYQNYPIGMDPLLGKFGEKGENGVEYLQRSYLEHVQSSNAKTGKPTFSPQRASDLQQEDFPEPRWAIEGLLPEGLTILAGPPKVGKSWLCLGVSLAVALGSVALGHIGVERGDVLYFGLEDSKRRLKDRLESLLLTENQSVKFPDNLLLENHFPKFDNDGIDTLDKWLSDNPNCRLVVIDTLGRVRPSNAKRKGAYDDDVNFIAPLQQLAHKHNVAILATHHTRKQESVDFVDAVSGTLGLAGSADNILILTRKRGQFEGNLKITGRDIEEREISLKLHKEGSWEFLGDAKEFALSPQRQDIVNFLAGKEPMGPKEISEALGKKYSATKKLVREMSIKGELSSDNGKYSCPIDKGSNRGEGTHS